MSRFFWDMILERKDSEAVQCECDYSEKYVALIDFLIGLG
jgi:hypothetical protein